MRVARRALALVVLGPACARAPVEVDIPLDPADRAIVVGVSFADRREVVAVDVERALGADALPAFDWDDEPVELTVFKYDAPLGRLGIAAGPLPPASAAHSRLLPRGDRAITARSPEFGWRSAEGPGWLGEVRLDGEAGADCLADGGCFDRRAAAGECKSPCDSDFAAPAAPTPPTAPAPPSAACPWSRVDRDGLSVCRPWPGPPPRCQSGRLDPTEGCVDFACPADDFPAPVGTGRAVYVTPNGVGLGTREQPTNLRAALRARRTGDELLLGRGTHDTGLQANTAAGVARLRLAGVCPGQTFVTGPAVFAGTIEVEGLTVQGSSLWFQAARARLARVEVAGSLAEGPALRFSTSEAEATDVVVRAGRGGGIRAIEGSTLTLRRVSVEEVVFAGAAYHDASRGVVEDAAFVRIAVGDQDSAGAGLFVGDGSRVEFARVAVADTRIAGLLVDGRARAQGRDLFAGDVLGKTRPDGSVMHEAGGILIRTGGSLVVEGAVLADGREHGIRVHGAGSRLDARDVSILGVRRRVLTDGTVLPSGGVAVSHGAEASLTRLLARDVEGHGLAALDEGALTVADADVALAAGPAEDLMSAGIAHVRSRLTVERGRLVGAVGVGVYAHVSAHLTLTDVAVADVRGTQLPLAGIRVSEGSRAVLERVEVRRVPAAGLLASSTAEVEATDLSIGEVFDGPPVFLAGGGILAVRQSAVRGRRVSIGEAVGVGLLVADPLSVLELEDLGARDLRCPTAGCPPFTGYGALAVCSATLSLRRFALGSAPTAALGLALSAVATGEQGVLGPAPIGLHGLGVEPPIDPGALDRVVLREIDRAIERLPSLAIPCVF